MLNANDETQWSFATSRGYAIYTFNVGDYCRLHTEWLKAEREHAGIIIGAQQKFSVGEQVRRILRLRAQTSSDAMRNRLEALLRIHDEDQDFLEQPDRGVPLLVTSANERVGQGG